MGVIEHELLHIVFNHVTRCSELERYPQLHNIACDIAINQMINQDILPHKTIKLCMPELYKLEKNKNAEWYYKKLYEKADKINISCSGSGDNKDEDNGQFDSHEGWGKENEQISEATIKDAVSKAYSTAKQMGNVPGELEEIIKDLLKPPVIRWNHLLKQYVSNKIKLGFKTSWKRRNRRLPDLDEFKGKVSNRTLKIMVGIDTSGSVSDEDFIDFLSEIKGILNVYKCKIKIVQCDYNIQKEEDVTPYSKHEIKFKGRGGTSFKPIVDKYNKTDDDLLIYFTDGYGDQNNCYSNKNIIWIITKNGNIKDFNLGKVIQMN